MKLDLKSALKLRKYLKKRKPKFLPTGFHKKHRVKSAWRKPRGWHNKVRLQKRGRLAMVKTGYGTPIISRHVDASGLTPVLITHLSQLDLFDPKKHGLVLSSILGTRKKITLVETAVKKQFTILNLDGEAFLKGANEALKERKEEKGKKEKTKKEKKKKLESRKKKQEKETENIETEAVEAEKKIVEKKEKDKILITKKE